MSSSKTEHYQLHRWGAQDEVRRTEFNENFTKLDQSASVVYGSYTGNRTASQFIDLGFAPSAVLVISQKGQMSDNTNYYHGGLAFSGLPAQVSDKWPIVKIEGTGFWVYANFQTTLIYANDDKLHYYIAFR